jgi:hypothetical protein
MTNNNQNLDALVERADIMAGMLRMGERIAYGTDADMICALSEAITAIRRDLLAAEAALAGAVTVKPLVWVDIDDDYSTADHPTGFCEVVRYAGGWEANFCGVVITPAYPDREAAKAAAQADYETRIRAALIPAMIPEGE